MDRKDTRLHFARPGRVRPEFKDEVDINNVVKRWAAGQAPEPRIKPPLYGDFTNAGSYLDAFNQVAEAHEDFMALPAKVRDLCDNDPGQFLLNVNNPDKLRDMIELGLLADHVPTTVVPEPTAPPAPPEPPAPPAPPEPPAE